MPRVSICLPNLNNRPYLEERLQSIYDQTIENWELVIVDNYSDDGAWELFQEHAEKEERIRLSQAPKAGMYANWNNTLEIAQGEWIYIATSDDTMYPDCIERVLACMDGHPGHDVCFFGIDVIDAQSKTLEHWHSSWKRPPVYTWNKALEKEQVLSGEKEFLAQIFASGAYQSITGVLFSRKAWEKTGAFPNGFGSAGDTFWIMELVRNHDIVWLPDSLATWRLHGNQASRTPPKAGGAKTTSRDQAVTAALQSAASQGDLNETLLKEIEVLRDESRTFASSQKGWFARVWNRCRRRSPGYEKRAAAVEQLHRLLLDARRRSHD